MKRLILMRHAKSSWGDPMQEDHARPLNGRGRRSATAVGDWLRSGNYEPDQVLSSSSARTRETLECTRITAPATFLDALYHASAAAMLAALKRAEGNCTLMLGHNPGIAWFAQEMVDTAPNHPRFADYPTCATLIADFPINDWADLTPGTGQVVNFITPRELTD